MNNNRVTIVVSGGMVQDVYADDPTLDVEIIDFDTEEENQEELMELRPPHQVW